MKKHVFYVFCVKDEPLSWWSDGLFVAAECVIRRLSTPFMLSQSELCVD